jgi:hypothetical protein
VFEATCVRARGSERDLAIGALPRKSDGGALFCGGRTENGRSLQPRRRRRRPVVVVVVVVVSTPPPFAPAPSASSIAGTTTPSIAVAAIAAASARAASAASPSSLTRSTISSSTTSLPSASAIVVAIFAAIAVASDARAVAYSANATIDAGETDFTERAKFIPLRLDNDERKMLRLLEAALHVSEYTDKVDVMTFRSKTQRITKQLREICAIMCGLGAFSSHWFPYDRVAVVNADP